MMVLSMMAIAHAGFFEDLRNTVSGYACLASATGEIAACGDLYDKEVKSRSDENDNKQKCCAYMAVRSCVLKVAERDCGDRGEKAAESATNSLVKTVTSQECLDYGMIACITMTQMILSGIIASVALLLLSCLCCCCCGRR